MSKFQINDKVRTKILFSFDDYNGYVIKSIIKDICVLERIDGGKVTCSEEYYLKYNLSNNQTIYHETFLNRIIDQPKYMQ